MDIAHLYSEHSTFIRMLLRRLLGPGSEPEDLAHEVFVVAMRKLPDLELGSTEPRVWLAGIAVRLAANARRRSWFRRLVLGELSASDRHQVEWRTPERAAQNTERARRLYALLEELPLKKREAFILYELQGLTCAEIAHALGCPLQTVFSRVDSARRHILQSSGAPPRSGARR